MKSTVMIMKGRSQCLGITDSEVQRIGKDGLYTADFGEYTIHFQVYADPMPPPLLARLLRPFRALGNRSE